MGSSEACNKTANLSGVEGLCFITGKQEHVNKLNQNTRSRCRVLCRVRQPFEEDHKHKVAKDAHHE